MAGKNKKPLKSAILDLAQIQIDADDPPETKQTLNRLKAANYSHDDAMALIGRVVMAECFYMMRSGGDFTMPRYVANLHRLPGDPEDL